MWASVHASLAQDTCDSWKLEEESLKPVLLDADPLQSLWIGHCRFPLGALHRKHFKIQDTTLMRKLLEKNNMQTFVQQGLNKYWPWSIEGNKTL